MNEKEAIIKSIEHHERMQKWVKTQDKNDRVSPSLMYTSINEDWSGSFCALCQLIPFSCKPCPLYLKYGNCGRESKNAWTYLNDANTWKEWLRYDKKLVKQLKSLLK
jgi:hypothetical protein